MLSTLPSTNQKDNLGNETVRPAEKNAFKFKNLDLFALNKYKNIFKEHDTDNDGFLQGDKVKVIWMKSGNTEILI